jgi:hypothetical protein
MDPAHGTVALALAVTAMHPGGLDGDHLLFELSLLLDEDRRAAETAVAALVQHGAVLTRPEKRGTRYRVLPPLRPVLAAAASRWLDALERRGGAAGAGTPGRSPFRTSPPHALGLLLALVAATAPRVKSSAFACELHAKDQARVHNALLPVCDRGGAEPLLLLAMEAGLVRSVGTRLRVPVDLPSVMGEGPAVWRRLLLTTTSSRTFPAVLELAGAAEPGFVPETTLRRVVKQLRHTEQVLGAHPFPTDGRGNEAGARSELESLCGHPLVERGQTPEGVAALRIHPAVRTLLSVSPRAGDGHVGADHEVHVGPLAPTWAAASLGHFAQPVALDRVSRFALTPESVAAAASRGMVPEEMDRVLRALAVHGVPENVRRTLTDYGTRRGRAVLAHGTVVAFSDAADADRAAADAVLAPYLGERVGLSGFLVDARSERQVRARLVELGLAVGEETVSHAGRVRVPLGDEDGDEEVGWAARVSSTRQAARERALDEALRHLGRDPDPAVGGAVLSALTRRETLVDVSAVRPLTAKRRAEPPAATSDPDLSLFDAARRHGGALRVTYQPEVGRGRETMTVEVVETLERAGAPMVRVRFPANPKAPERVLRLGRVLAVATVPGGGDRSEQA